MYDGFNASVRVEDVRSNSLYDIKEMSLFYIKNDAEKDRFQRVVTKVCHSTARRRKWTVTSQFSGNLQISADSPLLQRHAWPASICVSIKVARNAARSVTSIRRGSACSGAICPSSSSGVSPTNRWNLHALCARVAEPCRVSKDRGLVEWEDTQ